MTLRFVSLFALLFLSACISSDDRGDSSGPTNSELSERIDALEAEVTALGNDASALAETVVEQGETSASNTDRIDQIAGQLLELDDGVTSNSAAVGGLVSDLAVLGDELAASLPVRTVLTYTGSSAASASPTFSNLVTLGTFTKEQDSTDIRLTWVSHVQPESSGGFCNFQPRIDGSAGANSYGAVVTAASVYIPVAVTQAYSGLAAGEHTVSLWIRGLGTECRDNPGNYDREVFIEEVPSN